MKQNISDKIHNFSTKCTIKINKNTYNSDRINLVPEWPTLH
jgi:hypothetical protein